MTRTIEPMLERRILRRTWGRPSTHQVMRQGLRWGGCFLLVLLLHAGVLFWLGRVEPIAGPATPEAIMLDLAPEPTAPPPTPAEPSPQALAMPEPVQPPADMPPDPVIPAEPSPPASAPPMPPEPSPPPLPLPREDLPPPVPQAEVSLPAPPKPPPPLSRHRPDVFARPRSVPPPPAASTPSVPALRNVPVGAATTAPPGVMEATWQARLLAHLARFRRFPPAAQRRGEQGTVLMRFMVARDGSVLAMGIVQGSGYADLDDEARAWMARAEPLPAFPPDMTEPQKELVVPLRFLLR